MKSVTFVWPARTMAAALCRVTGEHRYDNPTAAVATCQDCGVTRVEK